MTTTIQAPTHADLCKIVEPYLKQNPNLGFAVGYASPLLPAGQQTGLLFAGNPLDQGGQPMTLDGETRFWLASVTKTFGATLFAHWSTRIGSLGGSTLGAWPWPGVAPIAAQFAEIPMLALANYTSGLPFDNKGTEYPEHPTPRRIPYTVPALFDFLGDANIPVQGTGTQYTYSNLAFSLLAAATAVAAASTSAASPAPSFIDSLRKCVLDPLGFSAATRTYLETPVERLPRGFTKDGTVATTKDSQLPAFDGGGGLVSTANDMLRWLQYNMGMLDGCTLNSLLETLQTPSTTVVAGGNGDALGLGWFLGPLKAFPGLNPVWKDGGKGGFASWIGFQASAAPGSAASTAGIFVLVNGHPPVGNVAQRLLELMTGTTAARPFPEVDADN